MKEQRKTSINYNFISVFIGCILLALVSCSSPSVGEQMAKMINGKWQDYKDKSTTTEYITDPEGNGGIYTEISLFDVNYTEPTTGIRISYTKRQTVPGKWKIQDDSTLVYFTNIDKICNERINDRLVTPDGKVYSLKEFEDMTGIPIGNSNEYPYSGGGINDSSTIHISSLTKTEMRQFNGKETFVFQRIQ